LTSDNPQGEEFEITPENKEFVEWVGQVVQVQSNRGL
jgi:phage repressor protein C with HTH and peptisase S24 domain